MSGEWIDASAFENAAKALERKGFERAAGRTVAWALRRSANVVRRQVRAAAKPHRKRGRLSSNVRTSFAGTGLDFSAKVRSTGPVAHLIAGGVRPHAIEPGRVMAIHGAGKSGPIVGFATAVQHPGFRADPYFHRGVTAAGPEIKAIVDKSAETMRDELAFRMRGK